MIRQFKPVEKIMSVLVTQQAPDFTSAAVLADGSIVDNFTLSSLNIWVMLVS
jgi:hypothetical protein